MFLIFRREQPSQAVAATYNSDRISALSVATCYRISDFVNLQTLVSGIILVELSQISFLQRLLIGNNNLEGQIPDKIFELKRLTELYLMSNKFVGSILNSISNLEMLTKLDLSGNRYNGSVGDSMTKLNQLIWIDLSHNFFTGSTSGQLIARIPNELLKMEMVQGIDISNNNLSGDGEMIAVKNLNFTQFSAESDKSFNKEMNTLAKLRNRNLVKVVGYAWVSGKLKPLFLEYMENGNLDRVIHDSGIDRSRWDLSQRVDVIVSVSRGAISAEISYDYQTI
ncbi:hypothetical protein L1987_80018 [Smallanthus sonchifolius]|uniref:Uncharacterized protein n=1 Tax=Smallanthus sonchifolius TaxID=185202 RepID=A0ACB8YLY5_9ASTR|nr:hypothetical protein L1987_80018 [Smallanthus sonchifolius]